MGPEKLKNYLQVGNKIHVNFNTKSQNKLDILRLKLEEALSPFYFDHQQKLRIFPQQ